MLTTDHDPITDRLPTAADRAAYHEHGYVILRGWLHPAALEALRDDVRRILAARNMDDSFLAQTYEYLADGPVDRLVNSQRLRATAGALLGDTALLYMPFTAVKGGGHGPFSFHQDNQYTLVDAPACNCWCALGDCTPANGCLRLVPGSHRWGLAASRASEESPGFKAMVRAPTTWDEPALHAGDIIVFDRLTVHGSGPNTTTSPRIGYAVQYARHDARWLDRATDTWRPLATVPRWPTGPVPELTSAKHRGE